MMIGQILMILSSGILGIFLGTQITEAVLFVPYWKALKADLFFELHQTYGKKIYQFFAPITIAATMIPLLAVAYQFVFQNENLILTAVMGIATLVFFSTYFLYFKKANKGFEKRTLSNDELPKELVRWGNWHWGRICFELIAFCASLILLIKF